MLIWFFSLKMSTVVRLQPIQKEAVRVMLPYIPVLSIVSQ